MSVTMKYMTGDIWELSKQLDAWVVIPTNKIVRSDGRAVMGAGLAKQAAERYPDLPNELGLHITSFPDQLFVEWPIICLPTKHDWRKPSTLELVTVGCVQLKSLAKILTSVGHNNPILVPQLGCGLGGLNWEREVRPTVDAILEGDRFIAVTQ